MQEPNDSFDPLMSAFECGIEKPPIDNRLRNALLAQTVGVLRFRRRRKRFVLAASLVGCYLAGVITMGIMRFGNRTEQPSMPQPIIAQSQSTLPHSTRAVADPKKTQVAAKKKKPTGFESWRRIGDRCLRETGDISTAVAGYSEAIHLASAEERRISPETDNWLIMALKLDAQSREKNNAYSKQN
jgi:hypothetical protein